LSKVIISIRGKNLNKILQHQSSMCMPQEGKDILDSGNSSQDFERWGGGHPQWLFPNVRGRLGENANEKSESKL
jgi:hypothetical protein